jgi:hypothetical protein
MSDAVLDRPSPPLVGVWIAIIAGQLAWLCDLELGYLAVYWACGMHNRGPLLTISVVMFAVAAGSTLYSWRVLARTTHGSRADAERAVADRFDIERFLGQTGVLLGVLAVMLIIGMAIPRLTFDPCIH